MKLTGRQVCPKTLVRGREAGGERGEKKRGREREKAEKKRKKESMGVCPETRTGMRLVVCEEGESSGANDENTKRGSGR